MNEERLQELQRLLRLGSRSNLEEYLLRNLNASTRATVQRRIQNLNREELRRRLEIEYRIPTGGIMATRPPTSMNRMRSYLATMRPGRVQARLQRYRNIPAYVPPRAQNYNNMQNYTRNNLKAFLARNNINANTKRSIQTRLNVMNRALNENLRQQEQQVNALRSLQANAQRLEEQIQREALRRGVSPSNNNSNNNIRT